MGLVALLAGHKWGAGPVINEPPSETVRSVRPCTDGSPGRGQETLLAAPADCIRSQGRPPFCSPPGEQGESGWLQGGPGWAGRSGPALRQLWGGIPTSGWGEGGHPWLGLYQARPPPPSTPGTPGTLAHLVLTTALCSRDGCYPSCCFFYRFKEAKSLAQGHIIPANCTASVLDH